MFAPAYWAENGFFQCSRLLRDDPDLGRSLIARMKYINVREFARKSGCTLRRTWGTRPGKEICRHLAIFTT